MIDRNDGKTLYGALRLGLDSFVAPYVHSGLQVVRFYFGNIDVRFHLARQENPSAAIVDLINEYIRQLNVVQRERKVEIEVVATLPIEDISRVLPKTGYYKGQPYFGTWDERTAIHLQFNAVLRVAAQDAGFTVIEWPNTILNDKHELSFDAMEKPRSVHLGQYSYLWEVQNENYSKPYSN
jgi:hypothetical protein